MKKRFVSVLLILMLTLTLAPPVSAAENMVSGLKSMPKLSADEITRLLEENPTGMPTEAAEIYDAAPSLTAPYAAGAVKNAVLQKALNRLNALRAIAGLPAVVLDDALCENAQYGAVLLAASEFGHNPARPADMDEAFYETAHGATASSNISAGSSLVGAVDSFMNDSDTGNIDRVGHRRWQLNPTMGKVGFGYVLAPSSRYGRFSTEKVFDRSGAGGDYDFIAWPASGSFPATLFGGGIAWSVTLDPAQYTAPDQTALTVTLRRESDAQTWTFSGAQPYSVGSGDFFNVNNSGYGVSNCIIFRPAGVSAYDGLYSVSIEGLKTVDGNEASISYQVDFFTPGDKGVDTGFADVPKDAYYASAVKWAVENGVTTGTSLSTFSPNDTCTRGQVVTFLWRACGSPEPAPTENPFYDVSESEYWYKPVLWAVEKGITSGYSPHMFHPNDTCTRAHIVTFLWRAGGSPDKTGTGNWWDDPVNWARGAGVLDGTSRDFVPADECPRCDVVTYLYRTAR